MAINGPVDTSKIETRLLINGKFQEASDGGKFTLVSPFSRKAVCEVSEATEQDTDAAVAAAKAAQPAWAALGPGGRGPYLKKLASLMREHNAELAQLEAISMGKPIKSFFEGIKGADRLESAAEVAWTMHGETSLNNPGHVAISLRQPFGVCAAIIPWNVPVLFFCYKAGAALATGNTVVLKSSEKAPLTSALMAKLSIEAGFPPGVLNVLSGHGSPSGACLSAHMDVRVISFTGSARTGRLIQQVSAKSNLKAVILELGGKSPAIVCEDADVERAAVDLAQHIAFLSGQVCMASSRVYVHESIREQFIKAYKHVLSTALKVGDPTDASTLRGPQADNIQFDAVQRYIKMGQEEGGNLLLGGLDKVEGQEGFFTQPTIFTGTPEDARIMKEEIFGTVVTINSFKTEEEALQKANNSEYGLYASVYTRDLERAMRFAKGIEAGSIGVNCTSTPYDLPFGGYKGSGQGREGVVASLEHYLEHKSVSIRMG